MTPVTPSPTGLRISAGLTIGLGLSMAALPYLPAVYGPLADAVFWPLDAAPGSDDPLARLMTAITGGVIAGWGVMLALLSGAVWRADPEGVRRAALWGFGAWFVIDSAGSVAVGAPANVLPNLAFLASVTLPLMRR